MNDHMLHHGEGRGGGAEVAAACVLVVWGIFGQLVQQSIMADCEGNKAYAAVIRGLARGTFEFPVEPPTSLPLYSLRA